MAMWPFRRKPPAPDDPWHGSWSVEHLKQTLHPSFIRCNQSARALIGDRQFTHRLGAAVPLRDADQYGLPRGLEAAELFAVEDILVRHLEEMRRGILVLTISKAGVREFVFYVGDPEWATGALERARCDIASHHVQGYVERDPDWQLFRHYVG